MTALYNEVEPFAVEWMRELERQGHIEPGVVDSRPIQEIQPGDVHGKRSHFFAGIGGWPAALRLAGVADGDPRVWTGSCPCQPFSVAGRGRGTADERHLWPEWFRLIDACRPALVFGEQVASPAGLEWLDAVFADLEGAGYSCRAADLCAASVGAPHRRQRLFFVAHAHGARLSGLRRDVAGGSEPRWLAANADRHAAASGVADGLADADQAGRSIERSGWVREERDAPHGHYADRRGATVGMEHADIHGGWRDAGADGRAEASPRVEVRCIRDGSESGGATRGFWSRAEWLPCRDGKARPVEPGVEPLAHGIFDGLASVLSSLHSTWEEVTAYASTRKADPREIVRVVQDYVHTKAGWEKQAVGVRGELHEEEVLLNLLLCAEAARYGATNERSSKKDCAAFLNWTMRSMHGYGGDVRSSCGWEPKEQLRAESPNIVSELSLILARRAASFRQETIVANASIGRTGALRGYGNAIVPQVAAAFVTAALDAIEGAP